MAFTIEKSKENKDIVLSATFVDKFMYKADGNFVKVYIAGLRQCNENKHLSNVEIANLLGLIESDVIRAWRYWESLGVVQMKQKQDSDYEIIFHDLDKLSEKPTVVTETKPLYSMEEISSRVRGDRHLEDLFSIASRILNKPLSTPDSMVIYSLYDYYRFPLEVIPLMLTFCMTNNKKSMRQIERVAQSWIDKGIDSTEKAEAYLKRVESYNKKIAELKKALGIYNRNFTPTETKYINIWLEQLGISIPLIAFAYDICMVNTGKLAMSYMNTILQDWHANGIKTPSQAKEYRKKNPSKPKTRSEVAVKSTSFSNYAQPEYDFDAIEKRALKKK